MSFKSNTTLGPGMANPPSMFAYKQNKMNSSTNCDWAFLDEEDPESRKEAQHANLQGGLANLFGVDSFDGIQVRSYP